MKQIFLCLGVLMCFPVGTLATSSPDEQFSSSTLRHGKLLLRTPTVDNLRTQGRSLRMDAAASDSQAPNSQQSNIWMLDTYKHFAYKIDTTGSPTATGTVTGVYETRPAGNQLGGAGNPYLVAVDSAGDAWVGNGFTTTGTERGSIVKILHSEDCGSTSDGLGALKWVPDAAGTSASPEDCRISRYIQLPSTAGGITAMGIDGADHLWVLAVSETLGSQATNFLNVYKIAFDSASAVLMYGPLTVAAGAMGSPGGNGAVVDRWGFLWTGSGTFQYDGADATTYSVLRFDTKDPTAAIRAFKMTHEANALSLDSDSNLWVAGGSSLSKVSTDPAGIIDVHVIAATPSLPALTLSTATSSTDIDLTSTPGLATACSDPTDTCCTKGNWDAGIAITGTATDMIIHVANICETGLVVQVKNAVASATPSVGAVIRTGSLIQSLGTDSAGNVWVSAPTISDFSIEPNPIYVIKNGASSATAVVGLSFLGGSIPVLTGVGDTTGYLSAHLSNLRPVLSSPLPLLSSSPPPLPPPSPALRPALSMFSQIPAAPTVQLLAKKVLSMVSSALGGKSQQPPPPPLPSPKPIIPAKPTAPVRAPIRTAAPLPTKKPTAPIRKAPLVAAKKPTAPVRIAPRVPAKKPTAVIRMAPIVPAKKPTAPVRIAPRVPSKGGLAAW